MPKRLYLKGPVSLTEMYDERTGKHIYLFGDEHIKKSTCKSTNSSAIIDLHTLIDQLVNKNKDKQFDIFLEYSYSKNDKKGNYTDSYMKDLFNYFENCLKIDKNACKYKNARLHYSDIRYESVYMKTLGLIGAHFLYTSKDEIDIFKSLVEDQVSILKKYSDKDISLKNAIKHSKASKELSLVSDKLFQTIIKQHIDKYSASISLTNMYTNMEKNNKILLFIAALTTDVYLMSRMFKDSLNTKNIIVYMGYFHIENYIDILKDMGFKTIHRRTSEYDGNMQCIDISDFKFFEYNTDIKLINEFCKSRSVPVLNKLSPYAKQLFIKYAKICISRKTGNIKIANIILKHLR